MNRIRLDVEGLVVDSFPTGARAGEAKGTVRAAEATRGGPTCHTSCYPDGDPACTCPAT